ncbi:MAG TPA: hypothetical protein VIC62_16500, partial [Nakamurella sp.]
PADDTGIGLLPPVVVAELSRVVDASLAQASQRAYRGDWRRFTAWAACRRSTRITAARRFSAGAVSAACSSSRHLVHAHGGQVAGSRP